MEGTYTLLKGPSSAPDERGKTCGLNSCMFVAKEVIHEPN
jgi:hypothetical protein